MCKTKITWARIQSPLTKIKRKVALIHQYTLYIHTFILTDSSERKIKAPIFIAMKLNSENKVSLEKLLNLSCEKYNTYCWSSENTLLL